jgi:hypothetical protein
LRFLPLRVSLPVSHGLRNGPARQRRALRPPRFTSDPPPNPIRGRQAIGYDVAGPPVTSGVTRIVDSFGLSQPVFEFSGTAGQWLRSTDRFFYSGLESAQILQAAMEQYASLKAAATQGGSPLPRLELYCYYTNDDYVVEPSGPQGIVQSDSAPTLITYQFRWIGVQSLLEPVTALADDLLDALTSDVGTAITGLGSSISSMLNAYSPFSSTAS